jgi:glycosyltransferase involved in cell wall biosynthesis
MIDLLFLRDFPQDKRLSMDIYADSMAASIREFFSSDFSVREYTPRLPGWAQHFGGLRSGRFVLYPLQAMGQKSSLYHIIEHGYAHLMPFVDPKRTIVTAHDLMPLLRWKGRIKNISPGRMPLLAMISLSALKQAAHIIAVSNNTRDDLIELLGCDPNKITVIYSGIDPLFRPFTAAEKKLHIIPDISNDPAVKKVMISGSAFYKNNETALKTISQLKTIYPHKIQVVKTGLKTAEWDRCVDRYGLANEVIDLGIVSRQDMAAVYNNVDVLLFPSLYEGFGWPPLEAMACETPVVCSNAASLPEVVGDAGIMLDPYDYLGFAHAIRRLFTERGYRQLLVDKGISRVKSYTWEKTAAQTIEIYRNVAGKNGILTSQD